MKYYIEDANPKNIANCSVHLKVSGTPLSNVAITSIVSITDGYLKPDKRVKVRMSESLLEEGYYDINKGDIISVSNFCTNAFENFEIETITEVSSSTEIILYGKEKVFKDYFKTDYAVGNVSCYSLLSTVDVENLNNFCQNPTFEMNDIKKDSFTINITSPNSFHSMYYVQYRVLNTGEFIKLEGTAERNITIRDLLPNTIYEVQICGRCNGRYTSFYGASRLVRTL